MRNDDIEGDDGGGSCVPLDERGKGRHLDVNESVTYGCYKIASFNFTFECEKNINDFIFKFDRIKSSPIHLRYQKGKCNRFSPGMFDESDCAKILVSEGEDMDIQTYLQHFIHSNITQPSHTHLYGLTKERSASWSTFLVLDLEGKVEILEFPVLLFDAKTMDVVDLFHRFVRPTKMHEERINQYIEGKYGKLGVDCVWHDIAIPFAEVIEQFEVGLASIYQIGDHLWRNELGGCLNNAAFVSCGNWDLKTKVPQQCTVAGMKLPPYFMEWINLKDVFLNFYKRRAPGMLSMMRELQIPLSGSHHLGIDDSNNVARVIHRMRSPDGALLQITARRDPRSPEKVEFLFKNRIV
ncbi:hypothetical protein RND71_037904 [Anisodus tanguticus]|uniref:Exonuclease domain-containing protein n=1 Tax=Anisodus tanguticus TaxID=243964 RepID=A0AAE1QYZ9_9SOLA|nr:hypothetical protein RND71_037904 [Anisodus tanguticus]